MPLSAELEFHPQVLVTHVQQAPMKFHLPAAALRAEASAMQVGS